VLAKLTGMPKITSETRFCGGYQLQSATMC
jgi:hypothetical protein